MNFVDREAEVDWLADRLTSGERQLLVLYGRRRVGKTALVTRALSTLDQPSLYFLCDERGTEANAQRFAAACADALDDVEPAVDGFEDAFRYLANRVDGPFVVAIDEFSYLVSADETVPSVFQGVFDETLAGTDVSLVLFGSSISMMEEGTLSYESPLYGRRTGQWRLEPFGFGAARQFVPGYDTRDQIRTYAVFGGMPAYLEQLDPSASLLANAERRVLTKGSFLYEEPEFLLRQELHEPATYMAILEAVSAGSTRVTEIANEIDRPASSLSRYLQNLSRLALLEKETPVTDPEGRRVYRIADDFLRFWFRFVSPNRAQLERGATDAVLDVVREGLPTHTIWTFEAVCREAVSTDSFPVECSRVGRWWYGEDEVDVVGLNEGTETLLLGECKWTNDPVGPGLLRSLEATEPEVGWRGDDRAVTYALFSKAGFTDDLAALADERDDLLLYDVEDVAAAFD
ncbi:ATP-binding protein [Salinirubellus salinus]|uniref:ATP-binding protein n=1 Tax=Salinirubellus salinus TaxID=1364945 RepID=A0A9E7U960_9EURY|nr:ATP-binding protein [Salinirubellus salinus]UWM52727.1 ATP-binding protein [Salinirubellus salinus]